MDPAIIPAASGLTGALIGGIGGYVAQAKLEKKRAAIRAKAGARLIRAELAIYAEHLAEMVNELKWWPYFDTSMEPWPAYRDVIAVDLDPDDWVKVSQAAIGARRLDANYRASPRFNPDGPTAISAVAAEPLLKIREEAIAAYNYLGPLAKETEHLSVEPVPIVDSKARGRPMGSDEDAQSGSQKN